MSCTKCLNKADCIDKLSGPYLETLNSDNHIMHCDEKYFRVGQIVTLKGRLFKVKSIKPKEIRLKLWKQTTNTGGVLDEHN